MFYPEPQPRMQDICQPSDSPFGAWCLTGFIPLGRSSRCSAESSVFSWFPRFLMLAVCVTPLTLKPRGAQWHTGLHKEFCLAGCEQLSSSLSLQVRPSCRRAFPSGCTLTLTEPEDTWQLHSFRRFPCCLWRTVAVWQIRCRVYFPLSVFFSFSVFS